MSGRTPEETSQRLQQAEVLIARMIGALEGVAEGLKVNGFEKTGAQLKPVIAVACKFLHMEEEA